MTCIPGIDLVAYPTVPAEYSIATCPKKKVKLMTPITNEICIETPSSKSDVQIAKDYLFHVLRDVEWNKDRELQQHFGLLDDDPPEDFEEFFQRLKDGKFKLEEKYRTGTRYWKDYLRWRDPDLKEDRKGYKAAMEAFTEEYRAARHTVAIKSPEEGLEAITKLERWKPSKK